jgi:uncharacterized protein YbaR (Trm112 family)
LPFDGYEAIDPSHPLGGPDGGKDICCKKDGKDFVVAVYFPRGQKDFRDIKQKFEDDLSKVKSQSVQGFVFFTNQELTLGERAEFEDRSPPLVLDTYHLERIACSLDAPRGYGLRLEFLSMEMTKEEQVSFFNDRDQVLYEIRDRVTTLTEQRKQKAGISTVVVNQENPATSAYLIFDSKLIECKKCGEVFRAQRNPASISLYYASLETVTCPSCGKVQAYR